MSDTVRPSPLVFLFLAVAAAGCDLVDPVQSGHQVLIESGSDTEIIVLPVLPPPPGAPACGIGTGVGRAEVFGGAGGIIRLDPPLTKRRIGIVVTPEVGAANARFSIAEIPVRHPEVEANAPAGRSIAITLSALECDFTGQLGIYRWNGESWTFLQGSKVEQGSIVTIDLDSASRYALGSF